MPFRAFASWAFFHRGKFKSEEGLGYAPPSMMALANCLHHPAIGPDKISEPISGRAGILRSAKDLGRVLALARLESLEALEAWPEFWLSALELRFSAEWRTLGATALTGISALVANPTAFEQAHHTIATGLCAGMNLSASELRATAAQFQSFVIKPILDALG